jgi:hypothetical protein
MIMKEDLPFQTVHSMQQLDVIRLVIIARSLFTFLRAFTDDATLPKRTISAILSLLSIALTLRSSPKAPVRDHVTPLDAAYFGMALLGAAMELRKDLDIQQFWREQVRTAIGQYMPPQAGLRAFLYDLVGSVPLRIDPKYTERVQELEKRYAATLTDESARRERFLAGQEVYRLALQVYQDFSMHRMIRLIGGVPFRLYAARVCLSPSGLRYETVARSEDGESLQALVYHTGLGFQHPVAFPQTAQGSCHVVLSTDPDLVQVLSLSEAFERISNGSSFTFTGEGWVDIIYHTELYNGATAAESTTEGVAEESLA